MCKDKPSLPVGNPAELAKKLGNVAEVSMGGSSGGVSNPEMFLKSQCCIYFEGVNT